MKTKQRIQIPWCIPRKTTKQQAIQAQTNTPRHDSPNPTPTQNQQEATSKDQQELK